MSPFWGERTNSITLLKIGIHPSLPFAIFAAGEKNLRTRWGPNFPIPPVSNLEAVPASRCFANAPPGYLRRGLVGSADSPRSRFIQVTYSSGSQYPLHLVCYPAVALHLAVKNPISDCR